MHEAQEGQYDFNGNNDLFSFIQMAQSSGLLVIVRAGKSMFHFGDYQYMATMDELQLRKSLVTNSSLINKKFIPSK